MSHSRKKKRCKMVSFDDVNEKELKRLKKYGYEFIKPKSKQEIARLKGKTTLVLYKTGKLLIQGKKQDIEETTKLINFLCIAKEKKGISGVAIGTDESLKGDTFGGIVVAGFMADEKIRCELKQMGVKDSKLLLNPDVVELAKKIIEKYPKNYHIENIYPKEFNKLNLKSRITEILDILHERCFIKLVGKNKKIMHIVDLYPGCNVGDIKEKHAESKYIEVAAASIMARYGALMQIRELEDQAGFFIPLGSTHVGSALLEIKKKSLHPEYFVKLRFQNVRDFLA